LVIRGEKVECSVGEKKIGCLGASAPVEDVKGPIRLQILVDRASIEVFVNEGEVAMSSCFVPRVENKALELYSVGGGIRVRSMRVYEVKSAWR
jgi:sucrose-6-phosphate hydrolase SacC (GH32 family)